MSTVPLLKVFETSTPKPEGERSTETDQMRRKFFRKPTLVDRLTRPSTSVNGLSSEEKIKKNETTLRDIEKKDIEPGIKHCADNRDDTISVHDDTDEKLYSDDDSLYKNKSQTKQSHSHDSNSAGSSASSQGMSKFKLRDPILNVEKICSTKQFKQSKVKIQNVLQKNKMPNRNVKEVEKEMYEDVSDEDDANSKVKIQQAVTKNRPSQEKREPITKKNKETQKQIYEDITDDENEFDDMSGEDTGHELQLIDLREIDEGNPVGPIQFEEEEEGK